LLLGNFSIEWPIVEFNVPESWSLSIIPHISFNESYPDCVAQVTPNQQLDQAILDQGLQEMEQLLQAQGGKTLEDFELPIPAQLAAPGDGAVSKKRAKYNVTRQAQ
jgi:hypothetical protein